MKKLVGLVLLALAAGCHQAEPAPASAGFDPAAAKVLFPEATAMARADWQRLAAAPEPPTWGSLEDHSLSFAVLVLFREWQALPEEQRPVRFRSPTPPVPQTFAAALDRPGPATLIQAEDIIDVTCSQTTGDGRARGTVRFRHPSAGQLAYDGAVDYVVVRDGDAWRVAELSMPTVGLVLVRGEDGRWRRAEAR
jgi:hypothetical protein